jgi:cardiolipin synthase
MKSKENIINIPNLLTILRFLLAPVFIFSMIKGYLFITFLLFFIAAATDTLDGWIARQLKIQTEFGKFIDPAADKLLMTTAYIIFTIKQPVLSFTIPLWLTLLVIGRDILIVSGCWVLQVFNRKLIIDPIRIGKICTFSQVLTIFLLILFNLLETESFIFQISVILTTILTIFSGYEYVKSGMKQLEKTI